MEEKVLHIVDGKTDYYFDSRSLHDLVFIKAGGNYIDITLTSTQYENIRIQIGQFWKELEKLDIPHDLVRIDRSTIINLKRVEFVNQKKGTVTLRTGNNNSCVAIDVRLQLSDGILRLVSTCDTMRIVVMHTYDKATATFVVKGDDVAKDAAATILRIGLVATIVGNVASFARLELNAVFGFSHLLELLYGEFIHYCCGQFLILYSPPPYLFRKIFVASAMKVCNAFL